jgi:hypothetical protein
MREHEFTVPVRTPHVHRRTASGEIERAETLRKGAIGSWSAFDPTRNARQGHRNL